MCIWETFTVINMETTFYMIDVIRKGESFPEPQKGLFEDPAKAIANAEKLLKDDPKILSARVEDWTGKTIKIVTRN